MKKFDRFILGVMETLIMGLGLSVRTSLFIGYSFCIVMLMLPYTDIKVYRWGILLTYIFAVNTYIKKSPRFELDRKLLKDAWDLKNDKNSR